MTINEIIMALAIAFAVGITIGFIFGVKGVMNLHKTEIDRLGSITIGSCRHMVIKMEAQSEK